MSDFDDREDDHDDDDIEYTIKVSFKYSGIITGTYIFLRKSLARERMVEHMNTK